MSDLTDLDDTQRQLARTLRSQLLASEGVDPTINARLALLRQRALAAPPRAGRAWLTGLDGLAVAALLLVLVIVVPPQFPPFAAAPVSATSAEPVEVLAEEPEPEFYQDLELLQWLAHAPDSSV